nr:uncharacterized protein LOC123772998 [Procambarus clarkii]
MSKITDCATREHGLTDYDCRFFKLYKVLFSEGREALYWVFKWGRSNVENFLCLIKDKQVKAKIESDLPEKDYDITLLYACIDKITDSDSLSERQKTKDLKETCRLIKNYRNNFVHSPPSIDDDSIMKSILKELQALLEKALQLGGSCFTQDDPEVTLRIHNMNNNITKIMDTPLDAKTIEQYKRDLEKLRNEQKMIVLDDGQSELFSKYKGMSKIDPASFISGKERFQVADVFTRLEITQSEGNNPNENVTYDSLLNLTTEDGSKPIITVVEGEAGAGKTTLAKLILYNWMSQNAFGISSTFQGLQAYDLVLYAEARNQSISSFLSLLTVLMSRVSNDLDDEVLIRSVLNLNVLLIIDGLDELNAASEKLIKELFDEYIPRSNGKLHILVTTRPNVRPDLHKILSKLYTQTVHTKIKGIAQENRKEFILKLHGQIKQIDESNQDSQELVNFMKRSEARLGEHFRLPLNLTLLTYLWACGPEYVNSLTTSTGLYIALQEMTISRLSRRLQDHKGVATLPTDKLKTHCGEFLKCLYNVCLHTHSRGHMQLSSDSIDTLKNKCEDLGLPFNEMCSAFLVEESEWTAKGFENDFVVPHKSIMEFYVAYGIMLDIIEDSHLESIQKDFKEMSKKYNFNKEQRECLKQVLNLERQKEENKTLQDIMKNYGNDFDSLEAESEVTVEKTKVSDYQNVYLHLSGLLAHKHPDVLQSYAKELVVLLEDTKMKDAQWLDLVVETMCDNNMAALIAKYISKQLVVRDGHTAAALKMFDHLEPNIPVQIIMENEVCYIPQLDELLNELSGRKCEVEFYLKYQFKHSHQYGTSDSLLQRLTQGTREERCRVSRFTGNLKTLTSLPETVHNLRITLSNNEHAQVICSELDTAFKAQIEYLGVHVTAGVTPDAVKPLPVIMSHNKECATLWMSDVVDDTLDQACRVIRALLPPGGQYRSIMFPRSKISVAKCKELLTTLACTEVRVKDKGGIRLSSPDITKTQLDLLKTMTKETLNCVFYCSGESSMW